MSERVATVPTFHSPAATSRAGGVDVREDDARLAALCEREHGRLVGFLTLYTGDAWLADELAQEALVRLCARWRKDELRNVVAWLNRVAVNLANSTFRRRAAARRAAIRHGASPTEHRPADAADAIAVREAVAALPPRPREVIVLRYFEGWTVEEVAGHLGLAASSVRSISSRAVALLREAGLTDAVGHRGQDEA